MKVLLDCSPKKIEECSKRYNYNFGQLRTPLTSYAISGKQYGLDNGCFKRFDSTTWRRLLKEAKQQDLINQPVFVCAPDIVGDARRTLELFDMFYDEIKPLKACLVLQDGIGSFAIDWEKVDAVFVGGSDAFKISAEAISACKTAKNTQGFITFMRTFDLSKLHLVRVEEYDEKTRLQEEKYHAMIGDIARQAKHLNQVFDADSWKRLLVAQFRQDSIDNNIERIADYWKRTEFRLVPSLDGSSLVTLGAQTRDFPKYVAAGFIEWLYHYGAENNITWTEPEEQWDMRYAA